MNLCPASNQLICVCDQINSLMIPWCSTATAFPRRNPSASALRVLVEERVTVMDEIYRGSFVVWHAMDQFQARGLGCQHWEISSISAPITVTLCSLNGVSWLCMCLEWTLNQIQISTGLLQWAGAPGRETRCLKPLSVALTPNFHLGQEQSWSIS